MSRARIPAGATVIEIDPLKFYIIDIDSEKIQPWQAQDLKAELKKAGVGVGFLIASRGGHAINVREAKAGEQLPED